MRNRASGHWMTATRLALALITPMATWAVLPSVAMAAPAESAKCRVHAVLASKDPGGLPSNLSFLKKTLKDDQFAAYKSFHLIDQKSLSLAGKAASQAQFRSGHKLALSLKGGDEKRLRLHLELTGRSGRGKLIGTDYSIEDHGLFMIQAGAYQKGDVSGKLFFAIQCGR